MWNRFWNIFLFCIADTCCLWWRKCMMIMDEKHVMKVHPRDTKGSNNPLAKGQRLDRLHKPWWLTQTLGLEMESKYTHTSAVCTQITQSRLDYRQRSDYRWLRWFRSMEQKQGLPFACLLFLCTQGEQIMLCWKHRYSWMETGGWAHEVQEELSHWKGWGPFDPTSIISTQKVFPFTL